MQCDQLKSSAESDYWQNIWFHADFGEKLEQQNSKNYQFKSKPYQCDTK
jgi:hypothetical protein